MPVAPVLVLITYRALPGREVAAKEELRSLIATVVASEPDCSGITMLEDAADATRILLYEGWTSRDAYLGPHMQTPHLRAFIERAGTFMAGPPEITFWRTIAEEPAEV